MSVPVFLLAWVAALAMYAAVSQALARRDAVLSLRRMAALFGTLEKQRPRPAARLIESVGEVRGRLTAKVMERLRIMAGAERLLESAAVKWRPVGLLHRSIAFFLGGFALLTVLLDNRFPLLAVAGGVAAGYSPLWRLRRSARARVRQFEEQFPDCLEFISRSMRAGHALTAALEMAQREFSDPLGSELRRAFEEQNLGQPIDIVLRKMSQRVASMDLQFFVSAVLLQKRTGGNLAEILDKLAHLIRERFKLKARVRAVSAQGLMSGRILASIPLGVGVLMFVVNPNYARFFIDDPAGHELLAASLGLQFLGYLIIRKIVKIEV